MRRNAHPAHRLRVLPLLLGLLSAVEVGLGIETGRSALGQIAVELPSPPIQRDPTPPPAPIPNTPPPKPEPLPLDIPPTVVTTSATQDLVPPPAPKPRGETTPPVSPPVAKPSAGLPEPPAVPQPLPAPPATRDDTIPSFSPLPPADGSGPRTGSGTATATRGEKGGITIKVNNESIRTALELLATQSSMNLVPSTGVAGNVTLNLKDVTFEQALDVLLKVGNLGVRREGDVIYVFTAQEMNIIESKGKTPIVRVYNLNYVRANDLSSMLMPFLSKEGTLSVTPSNDSGIAGGTAAGKNGPGGGFAVIGAAGGGGSGGGGGSSGGDAGGGGGTSGVTSGGTSAAGSSVSTGSDTGGNSMAGGDTIVVRDHAENIAQIDEIVAKIDIQPMQVLIEAVILSVQLDNSQQLGVNFGLVDNMKNVAGVAGNGNLINAAAGFSPAKVLTTVGAIAPSLLPRPGQLVSGYLAPDQGLKFGFIDKNVSGFVRALETMNKVNILASPRVLVLNKQRAEIQLGQRLGYRNTVTNLTSSLQTVQFLSVGTLLSLRPFVSQDGMVRMEIHPEKSTGALDSNGIPQTNTSELTTNILIPDGATIVIGGLIDSSDQNLQQGVLGLNRLPVVGPLFRERVTKAQKTELIVLLTPRVLNRSGLPEPQPGLAPRGPSGVPNSGAMPGPAAFAQRTDELPPFSPIDAQPSPPSPMEPTPFNSAKLMDYGWIGSPKPMVDTAIATASHEVPVAAPAPASVPSPAQPAAPGTIAAEANTPVPAGPVRNSSVPEVQTASLVTSHKIFAPAPPPPLTTEAAAEAMKAKQSQDASAAPATAEASSTPPAPDEREIPITVSAPPVGEGKPAGKSKPGYRPGDLTRGLINRIASRTTPTDSRKDKPAPPDQPAPPPEKPAPPLKPAPAERQVSAEAPAPEEIPAVAAKPAVEEKAVPKKKPEDDRIHFQVVLPHIHFLKPRNPVASPHVHVAAAPTTSASPVPAPTPAGPMPPPPSLSPTSAGSPPERLVNFTQPSPPPTAIPAPTNPAGASRKALMYGWHTVQEGEDFGKLAQKYYGSASLRGALWKVNRHLVTQPEDLSAGMMILIPTTEILDRIVMESAQTDTAKESGPSVEPPASAAKEPPKRRFRLFGSRSSD